jgi:hypothetical protein
MKKLLLLMALVITFCLHIPVAGADAVPSLLVIGWDGAGLRNVKILLDQGKLPNLKNFLDNEGGHLVPLETMGLTVTMPNWTTFWTGLTYDQSGVLGNMNLHHRFYEGQTFDVFTSYNRLKGIFTRIGLWARQVPYTHTTIGKISTTYPVLATAWLGSKRQVGADPFFTALAEVAQSATLAREYSPRDTDPERWDGPAYLPRMVDLAKDFLAIHPDFIMFCLFDPDFYGHRHGENGARYLYEFERCDRALGQLLAVIDRSKTKIIVVSDHGFDEGGFMHYNSPDTWMATDLPIHPAYVDQAKQKAFGTMRDPAASLYQWYGFDYSNWIPQIRGKSLLDDRNPTVTIKAVDGTALEGGRNTGIFAVSRENGNLFSDLDVPYSLGGTAKNGEDYTALSGTVRIPARATTAFIKIFAVEDHIQEDPKTVVIQLRGGVDYRVGNPSEATVTVRDTPASP